MKFARFQTKFIDYIYIYINERFCCYIIPCKSLADVVPFAERSDTKSNINVGGFRSQLQASYVSSHTEELWYNETLYGWQYIYIYIYIYIERVRERGGKGYRDRQRERVTYTHRLLQHCSKWTTKRHISPISVYYPSILRAYNIYRFNERKRLQAGKGKKLNI